MKSVFLILLFIFSIFACSKESKTETDNSGDSLTGVNPDDIENVEVVDPYLIDVRGEKGIISKSVTFNRLKPYFGKDIKVETHLIEEATVEVQATVIDGLMVIWNENGNPKRLVISGISSKWNVEGVKIGTTIAELEEMNKKSFEFLGLGWDYGGYINDWKGGKLAAAFDKQLIQLGYDYEYINEKGIDVYPFLGSDLKLNSDMPELKKLNLTVQIIEINWE